jgi:hypothetical protein
MTGRRRAQLIVTVVVMLPAVFLGIRRVHSRSASFASASVAIAQNGEALILGRVLPDVVLMTPEGVPESLSRVLRTRPSLIAIVTQEDCLGCGEYGLELRIIAREVPSLTPLLIGIGQDTALFRAYLRENRIQGLLDPGSELGALPTPLVVVVDTTGRVLFVDDRSGPAGKSFPVSQVLLSLRTLFAGQPTLNDTSGGGAGR